jgi:hypothetical protein
MLHARVNAWFAGAPVYTGPAAHLHAYPPASMVLLAPVYGGRAHATTLVVWTAAAALALAWLALHLARESGATTSLERAFVALMPLATYPAGAVIGNGQSTLFVVTLGLAALLLLNARAPGWGRDVGVALLMLFALAKPAVAAPFFLIVAFAAGGLRPAVLICVAYAAITFYAVTLQPDDIVTMLGQLYAIAANASSRHGEANLHILLAGLGLQAWAAPASLVVVAALGLWLGRHRHADMWLRIGVVAIAARFWTYHRWYDDLIILLPLIALFRVAKRGPASGDLDLAAGVLCALTLAFLLAPGGLYLLPAPWNGVYVDAQVIIWLADLAVLLVVARMRPSPSSPEAAGSSQCAGCPR